MFLERLKARHLSFNEPTLNLVNLILLRLPLIAVIGLISILLVIAYLHQTTYRYTASYQVTPVNNLSGGPLSGAASTLGALAGINLSQGQKVTPYQLYLNILRSRQVADTLRQNTKIMRTIYASRWNEDKGEWEPPAGFKVSIIKSIKSVLGFPKLQWEAPSAADLQAFIRGSVEISEKTNPAIAEIKFDHPDPNFAQYFLKELHLAADNRLRAASLRKSRENIDYLQDQLSTTVITELRNALAEELGNQVKIIMIANSNAPFSAEPIGDVVVSKGPTKPNPPLVLVLGTLMGPLALIFFIVVGFYARRSAGGPD